MRLQKQANSFKKKSKMEITGTDGTGKWGVFAYGYRVC
jgi:hypothetical protein